MGRMPRMTMSPTSGASDQGFSRAALIPLALSLCGLSCGVLSILASNANDYVFATTLIIVAVFFDGLDGAAARALHVEGPFGEMLDSLWPISETSDLSVLPRRLHSLRAVPSALPVFRS
ncbi:MAG: hypothetical protein EBT22_13575 [Chloroflexi bacterium]|nr:hypothetical protein [Chloroflexota bacterium]